MAHMALWKPPPSSSFCQGVARSHGTAGGRVLLCTLRWQTATWFDDPKGSQRVHLCTFGFSPVCGDISERFPTVVSDHRQHIHNPTRMMKCVYVYIYMYICIPNPNLSLNLSLRIHRTSQGPMPSTSWRVKTLCHPMWLCEPACRNAVSTRLGGSKNGR